MPHRIRDSFNENKGIFVETVEVDEPFVGGLDKNKHESKKLKQEHSGAGKSVVVGVKERDSKKVKAKEMQNTQKDSLHDFIIDNVETGSTVNTDGFEAYKNLHGYKHEFVKHSVKEYVKGTSVQQWHKVILGYVGKDPRKELITSSARYTSSL